MLSSWVFWLPSAPLAATAIVTGPTASAGAVQSIANVAELPLRGLWCVAHCTSLWADPHVPVSVLMPLPSVEDAAAREPGWPQPSPERAVN